MRIGFAKIQQDAVALMVAVKTAVKVAVAAELS
jgi:hypothetical protein